MSISALTLLVLAAPVISAELPVDSTSYVARAGGEPKVASNGTGYLVVMPDPSTADQNLVATRVDASGAVLDRGLFRVSAVAAGHDAVFHAVTAGGGIYLAAWAEWTLTTGGSVYVRRISGSGQLLDASPVLVAANAQADGLDVTFDGADFLVVWSRAGSGLRAAKINPATGAAGSPTTLVAGTTRAEQRPSITFDGSNYLLAWEQLNASSTAMDLYARRFDTALAPVDGAPFALSTATGNQGTVELVTNPATGMSLAVWEDARNASSVLQRDIYGARIVGGAVQETSGLPIATTLAAYQPRAAFDGTDFAVTWFDESTAQRGHFALRVSTAGALVSPPATRLTTTALLNGRPASLAFGAGNHYFAYSEFSSAAGVELTYGSRLSAGLTALEVPATTLSESAASEHFPDVAFGGGRYLAVWADYRNGEANPSSVYAGRLDQAGVLLDSQAIAVAADGTWHQLPRVAYMGAGAFLVAWQSPGGAVSAARFDGAAGTLTDTTPLSLVATTGSDPAVACDGADCLVAWADTRGSGDIYGARVLADGSIVPVGGALLAGGAAAQSNPTLSFNGTHYLLTWDEAVAGSGLDVRGQLFTPAAAAFTTASLVAGGAGDQQGNDSAYDGSSFVVIFTHDATGAADVSAMRISPSTGLRVLPGGTVASGAAIQAGGDIAFDGDNHFVTWLERTGAGAVWQVRSAWLSPALATVASATISTTSDTSFGATAAVASTGTGRSLAVYRRLLPDPPFRSLRARARVTQAGGLLGEPCTGPADCVLGFCIDGVCCESACGNGAVDCQACNPDAGAATAGRCGFLPSTTVCRADAGVCDAAESCTGTSGTCPNDAYLPSSTVCRAATDVCDAVESCTGSAAACPSDAFLPSSTICRADAGVCDLAETCTGSAPACPNDAFLPSSTLCRSAAGACDAEESCTGSAAACPNDAFLPSSTVCRPDAGICDVAESCTGSSAACPGDAFLPAATTCRAAAGVCDAAEACTGSSAACPNDAFLPSTTVCRPDAGACDVAETCTGSAAACPNDAFLPSTATCRAAAGVCDVAESCTGSAAACPTDAFAAAGTGCRAATGACDAPEACTGSGAACPTDAARPAGTACDDGNPCTVSDSCSAGTCVGAAKTCPAPDECHAPASCEPSSGTCSSAPRPDGTACTGGTCRGGVCQPTTEEPPNPPGGCGCASAGAPFWLLAFAAAGLFRRRPAPRRPRQRR